MRDLFNKVHPLVAVAPAAAVTDNTPWVSGWINRKGYESLTFVLITGGEVDADATFAVTMQDADDAAQADAAAVPAANLLGTLALAGFTFADDSETRKIGYVGNKQYVKITVTPSANTGAAYLSIVALLGHPAIGKLLNPPV